ncbi:hypothetical protein C1646_812449 [Rhizophagus diaphanus]|nr:hypothetical protein C1646_812449 [Rhizophagus diaphanus] [Rhizophagus sp. MUCL 43196]
MSTRKRTILSAAQKCEICETKEKEPNLSNTSIAQRYNIGKSTQGEASSAPSVESIENDRLALQQFLRSYNPEDIWNGDETGLFWKMEPSRVLARGPISEKLDSVEVKFLPPNTTTALQPYGIVEVLADYNIFEALQNSAEAWSMVSSQMISNCWKKTGILPPSDDEIEDDDSIFDDFEEKAELERLIALLPEGDHLDAREYINIEDEMAVEGALTDDEIMDAVLNADKEEEIVIIDDEFVPILEKVSLKEAEKSVDNTIRFLYEQGPEFGEVNEELRILKGLHKRVKLQLYSFSSTATCRVSVSIRTRLQELIQTDADPVDNMQTRN